VEQSSLNSDLRCLLSRHLVPEASGAIVFGSEAKGSDVDILTWGANTHEPVQIAEWPWDVCALSQTDLENCIRFGDFAIIQPLLSGRVLFDRFGEFPSFQQSLCSAGVQEIRMFNHERARRCFHSFNQMNMPDRAVELLFAYTYLIASRIFRGEPLTLSRLLCSDTLLQDCWPLRRSWCVEAQVIEQELRTEFDCLPPPHRG
jgi:hypothetical protein